MRKSLSGFTIVELLVVIVVIGIIAAIAIVSYSSVQTRTQNTERVVELKAWQKSFVQYKAANGGKYPDFPVGGYCLGTGFPNQKCRDHNGYDVYYESNSVALMTALSTYDPPPTGSRIPVGVSVGPYADYTETTIMLTAVLKGYVAADCPAGTNYAWADGAGRLLCRITLKR
jgi:prepilin-type N-terminal cleavage/methylation domain-containing protein